MPVCIGMTTKGDRCTRRVAEEGSYCWQHEAQNRGANIPESRQIQPEDIARSLVPGPVSTEKSHRRNPLWAIQALWMRSPWMSVHFWTPLLPFFIATFIRAVLSESWSAFRTFHFFNAGELALAIGLIGIFARQSIMQAEVLLPEDEDEDKKITVATNMLFLTVAQLAAFIAFEVINTLYLQRNMTELKGTLLIFQWIIVFLTLVICIYLNRVQASIKLKTEFK